MLAQLMPYARPIAIVVLVSTAALVAAWPQVQKLLAGVKIGGGSAKSSPTQDDAFDAVKVLAKYFKACPEGLAATKVISAHLFTESHDE